MPTRIFSPDSPDEMAFGQLRAPISVVRSNPYAGSSSRILTDPTGERRSRQFCQRFRGLRSCRPNPSGESGFKADDLAAATAVYIQILLQYPSRGQKMGIIYITTQNTAHAANLRVARSSGSSHQPSITLRRPRFPERASEPLFECPSLTHPSKRGVGA